MEQESVEFPQYFEEFERNEEWFSKNSRKIEKKFRNKYLAVLAPNLIISDSDLDNLFKKIKKKGNLESAFITAVPPKGVASIL
jgi:methylphosphotriester-DNA--protein-cysteine methyltransferase